MDIDLPGVLVKYLRTSGRIEPDEEVTLQPLTGGVSNRAVLLTRADGSAYVFKQALAKLRVEADWFSDPARIEREAAGMAALLPLTPPGTITPLWFLDADSHLLAMEAVPSPHVNWKTMLLTGDVREAYVQQFATILAGIHRNAAAKSEELRPQFADRSFFETLRVEPYYEFTAGQVPDAAGFLCELIRDMRSNSLTLVHGDYSPKNILVHDDHLVLLDHEVIHWGDPAFDIGFGLAHLLSKAHHLPKYRESFRQAAQDFFRLYEEALGDVPWKGDLQPRAVRHALACTLARVRGKSPLEYLNASERSAQVDAVVRLIQKPLLRMESCIDAFLRALG